MTNSMTAFARAEHGAAVWEIRSVNHRYLDTSFRLPDSVRYLESELKGAFKDQVYRGKLECTLKINSGDLETSIQVNKTLVLELSEALKEISELSGIESRGDAISLMRWPDVLTTVEQTDDLVTDIETSFANAVTQLVAMRKREGSELASLIETRLQDIEKIVIALREETPVIIENQHEKLKTRIKNLDIDVDDSRLEQELVILAQKLDVMEELDRLTTHVSEVRRSLSANEPVGRRLDFLMQELNREANTLSSKAAVSSTTLQAVDLKVIIEQIREQIQNIE